MATTYSLDASVRRHRNGTVLVGGSPLRLMRLSEAGTQALGRWLQGGPLDTPAEEQLAARLVEAGLLHPEPSTTPQFTPADLTIVVPVHNDSAGVRTLAGALTADPANPLAELIVVDDGSDANEAQALADLAREFHFTVLRNETATGPAAARNLGASDVATELVGFVDADVVPQPGWLTPLLGHFDDPRVALAAPRVRAMPGASIYDRYESARSPLDLGSQPALIQKQTRVSYVPGAALIMRTTVFQSLGGFDAALRAGEDVDLVWRTSTQAVAAGPAMARYEPCSVAHHRNRQTLSSFSRQRRLYGTASAPLEDRHPGALSPVIINKWSAAVLALPLMLGRRGLAAAGAVAVGSAAAMIPRIADRVDNPVVEAARLGLRGHLHAAEMVANASWRDWLPATATAAVLSPRFRTAAAIGAVVPAAADWVRSRPPLDPVRFAALRTVDNASHGLGVVAGLWKARSMRAVLPRFTTGDSAATD